MTTTFPTLPYLFQLSPNLSYPLPFLHQALSYTSPEKAARRLEIMKVKKAGKVIINKVYLEDAKVKADKLQSQGDVAKLLAEEVTVPWDTSNNMTYMHTPENPEKYGSCTKSHFF